MTNEADRLRALALVNRIAWHGGMTMAQISDTQYPHIFISLYVPALVMVLRRPNVADA